MSVKLGQNQLINIPKNTYKVEDEPGKLEHSAHDHILKKKPLMGARVTAQKLVDDVFVYAPKGMKGSVNSNFYEFLSLGLVPNIIGSVMLMALYGAASGKFGTKDKTFSKLGFKNMAAGVVLYATMKWLAGKVINKGVKYTTGIDQDMKLVRNVAQLPEEKGDRGRVKKEIHGVFDSVKWYGKNELYDKGVKEENNRYAYFDKLTEKIGYNKPLNAPDQIVLPKLEVVLAKSKAGKYISGYLWAALGVAVAAQKPFSDFMKYADKPGFLYKLKDFPKQLGSTLVKSAKNVWNGNGTLGSKVAGRGLAIAALASSVLAVANANRGYRVKNGGEKPTTIDYKQAYTES